MCQRNWPGQSAIFALASSLVFSEEAQTDVGRGPEPPPAASLCSPPAGDRGRVPSGAPTSRLDALAGAKPDFRQGP